MGIAEEEELAREETTHEGLLLSLYELSRGYRISMYAKGKIDLPSENDPIANFD